MIKLTLADGTTGWVVAAAITAILPAVAGPQTAKSEIWIGTKPVYVQDDLDAVHKAVMAQTA